MKRVIKLGGSLLNAGVMADCLQTIAGWSGSNWVVAGGGVFADQVRTAQSQLGFDELAAHRAALLAMQQTAYVCHSLNPQFQPCGNWRSECQHALWLPNIDELEQAGIAASWAITSDSLALWLATQLCAEQLIVVKSAPIAKGEDWQALQAQGILDAAFGDFMPSLNGQVHVIHYSQLQAGA